MDKKKTKNKTSLQFKLTLMFFFVMLVSASISVSVLVMVCSPVMKSNAEQQLVELSMAMDQLEESLTIKNIPCLDEEEAAHIVNLWDEDKESIMGRVFYCFDGETITCVDNRDGDLFIERFEEKDALLAYMWMTDLMSSIDCYELLNKKEGDVLSGQQ